MNDNPLNDLLIRHPWIDEKILLAFFDKDVLGYLLEKSGQEHKMRVVNCTKCYALPVESDFLTISNRRYTIARYFILATMGKKALLSGISPSAIGDAETYWNGVYWRIWVDLGEVAPEAMRMFRNAPDVFADNIRDIIITTKPARFSNLEEQVKINWGRGEEVFLFQDNGEKNTVIRPVRKFGQVVDNYQMESVDRIFLMRQSKAYSVVLSNIAPKMRDIHWQLLAEIGNNPFLDEWELSYLIALKQEGDNLVHQRLVEKMDIARKAISWFKENHLIENPRLKHSAERIIPTWRSLELMAEYWGVNVKDLKKFQRWPQKTDKRRDQNKYSSAWYQKFHDHQELCREFCLALSFGGRSVANAYGHVNVNVITTIASKITYRSKNKEGKFENVLVVPDGLVEIGVFKSGENINIPKAISWNTLYVEIDRATNSIQKLDERLDRYQAVWGALQNISPLIVWVIDGTPYRESEIISKMREREIQGYTVLLERLKLEKGDSWWLDNPPVFGGRDFNAIGGLMPYRKIWRYTGNENGLVPFLNCEPWKESLIRQGG